VIERDPPRVQAVLGPTNTGKTHRAIQRMLAHRTGMIGLPLRLLAREVYDRVRAQVGDGAVAMITGEERVVPSEARYFVCTVESMPVERPVEFVAVDEIQLADHRERGHTFTDRILRARGVRHTLLLGSDTIEPLLTRLVPGVEVLRYERHSELRWSGARKLTGLPRRTAVVAFSVDHVYRLAERLRARRGGAAVVLGALSPRARNAQVAMYQAGDVQYLVATDAIGMGLNMDVDHVALAATSKFDGRQHRALSAAELAQIAGRAGRWRRNGTFGTTDGEPPLDPATVAAIEGHCFEPQRGLYYRNAELDLHSLDGLLRSLDRKPPRRFLRPIRDAADRETLEVLARTEAVRRRARGVDAISLLWEVCRVPDFRKTLTDSHTRLLTRVYLDLVGPSGVLGEDWLAERITRLDRTEGDLDALMTRIAWIRTWTYISHRPGWLPDAAGWQGRTRAIEDRLSDALHERLTARFVEHRSRVELGPTTARVEGFDVALPEGLTPVQVARVTQASRASAADRVEASLVSLLATGDDDLHLDPTGRLTWEGQVLGRLEQGPSRLAPSLRLAPLMLLEGTARARVRARLEDFVQAWVAAIFAALEHPSAAKLSPGARGLLYQLRQGLGAVPRSQVAEAVERLEARDRQVLRRLDVRLGTESVYVKAMLRPALLARRALLFGLHAGLEPLPAPPEAGRVMLTVERDRPRAWYPAVGFTPLGTVALRVDVVERVAAALRKAVRARAPEPPPEILSWAGLSREQLPEVARALGWGARRRGRSRRRAP